MADLGKFVPLEPEVVNGMAALAGVNINSKIIDLGCGDGSTMETILNYGIKPANVFGVEIDTELYNLALAKGLNVFNDDIFNMVYSGYDVIYFWFNFIPELVTLMNKLYSELKNNCKVICCHSSRKQWRDGIYIPEESYPLIPCNWQPSSFNEILGNRFYLYIK